MRMRLLALDTSTEACSVALLTGRASIERSREVGRGHGEEILGMVDDVLGEARLSLGQLDGIAAGVGPGSFTGVRISVAVAQGLAFGAGLAVVPVTTLEALALRAHEEGAERVLACLDARMGELYWGCFAAHAAEGVVALGAPAVSAARDVRLAGAGRYRGIGRGFAAYPELGAIAGLELPPDAAGLLPRAREMALLGALRLRAGGAVQPADLQPQYLRDKVALTEAERGNAK